MPIYKVEAPDGKILKVEAPDGATDEQILGFAAQSYKPEQIKADTGFTGSAKNALENLKADMYAVAGRTGLMDAKEAEQQIKQHKIRASKIFTPTTDSWDESPWLKIRELAGGSIPYMAAPLVAGAAATLAPPIAIAGGLITGSTLAAGAAGIAQFTGSNLSRQMDENQQLEQTNLMAAGAAAIPQAAFDTFGLRMIPGIRKIFGQAGIKITEKEAQGIAKTGLMSTIGSYAATGTKTASIEGLTEAGQQVFERLQAGLDLTDKEAQKEYFDNFIGGAVLGGALSVPGHAFERMGRTQATQPTGEEPPLGTPIAPVPNQGTEAPVTMAGVGQVTEPPRTTFAQPVQAPPPVAPTMPTVEPPVGAAPPVAPTLPIAQPTPPAPVTPQLPGIEPPVITPPNLPPSGVTGGGGIEQNRNRSTAASIAQMNKIAANPIYEFVGVDPKMTSGAPIVTGPVEIPANQLGKTSEAIAENGTKVPVQYAVVDAGNVLASHNVDGTTNANYTPDFEGLRSVVGNGRTAGLQASYSRGLATGYREKLIEDTTHGVPRDVIEGMQNPMLVRFAQPGAIPKDIGDISNVAGTLSLSTIDQARNDANRVDLTSLQFGDDGRVTRDTIRGFVQSMPTAEQAQLMDANGNTTRQAHDRLNAAIFHLAYGNDDLTHLAHQTDDPESQNIIRAMSESAPYMAQLANQGEYDVRPAVVDAAQVAINARRQGFKLSDFLKQQDMAANPLTTNILKLFAENPRSPKTVAESLRTLANKINEEANAPTQDMFGPRPKRTLQQIIDEHFQPASAAPVIAEKRGYQIDKPKEQIHAEVKQMTNHVQLAKWAVDNAPNRFAKYIAEKVLERVQQFQQMGIPMKVEVQDRSRRPSGRFGRSIYSPAGGGSFVLQLSGLNKQGLVDSSTGTRYSTILHELIHSVTQTQFWVLGPYARKKGLTPAPAFLEMESLLKIIKKQAKKDGITDYDILKGLKNVDELIAHGLTNDKFQDYMAGIKVGPKNGFTKMMEIIRKVLGIDPLYESALDQLMRVSEKTLAPSMQEVAKDTAKMGIQLGSAGATSRTRPDLVPVASDETFIPDFSPEEGNKYFKPQTAEARRQGYANSFKNPITLRDGTRLSGFTDPAGQTTFHGYEKNGERITMRRQYVNPDDIVFSKDNNKTAQYFRQKLAELNEYVPPAGKKAAYVTKDEIYEMQRNALVELRSTPAFQKSEQRIKDANAASDRRYNEVTQEAIRLLKTRPQFKNALGDLDESQIQRIAMSAFREQAEKNVPMSRPSTHQAIVAQNKLIENFFKRKNIPEPREFSEQANQYRDYYSSPKFQAWFQNSKAVNRDGQPLVAFHTTDKDFNIFSVGKNVADRATNPNYTGKLGSWFTAPSFYPGEYEAGNAENAVSFSEGKEGDNTMLVHLSVQNPMEYEGFEDLQEDRNSYPSVEKFKQSLIDKGYDGVVVRNSMTDGDVDRDDWVAFYDTQVKSAIGNIGNFDPNSPVISDEEENTVERLTKTMPAQTTGQAVRQAATAAWNNVQNNNYRTGLRVAWIDKNSGLTQSLASQPTFDTKGQLRADMLARTQDQMINLVSNGVQTGLPTVNSDGTLGIERSENNLARSQIIADKLDGKVKLDGKALSGRDAVAEVARILRGKDILKEDAQRRARGEQQAALAKELIQLLKVARDPNNLNPETDRPYTIREMQQILQGAKYLRRESAKNRKMNRELQVKQSNIDWAESQLAAHPELQQVLDIWKNVNDSLVTLWEKTGLFTKDQADEYRSRDNYVPLFKSREDLENDPNGYGGTGTKTVKGIQKLKGSYATRNIWENVEKHYAAMIASAYQNQTRKVATGQLKALGLAEIPEKATDPRINLRYRDPTDPFADSKGIVHVIIQNPNDLAAFQMMHYELGPLLKIAAATTRVLRAGALINPMYWIRQLIRDPIHASIVADSGIVTPFHAVKEYINILTNNSREAQILASRGVIGQVDSTMDIHEFLKQAGTARQDPNVMQKMLHKVMRMHEASDGATRVAIYKNEYAAAKAKGMSEEHAVNYAVHKARESINFAVHGNSPTLNALRNMVPFLSAALTSLDTVYRAATGYGKNEKEKAETQKLFITRAAMMTAMCTAYAMAYQNDDDYKKLPDYVKDNNWLIPNPFGDGHSFIKLATPFEVGFFFKTIPEAAVRYMYGTSTGKEVLASYAQGIAHNLPGGSIPPISLIPQALKPFIETQANYSFFTGRPIEGMSDQGLPVAARGERASELAKILSSAGLDKINLSPAKIDYLIQGYMAELGTFTTGMASDAILSAQGRTKPARNIEEMPFNKAFMTNPNTSKAVADFYELTHNAQEAVTYMNRLKATGQVEEAKAFSSDEQNKKLMSAAPVLRNIGTQMTELRKAMNYYTNKQDMDPEERRIKINQLSAKYDQVAAQGYKVAQSAGINR